MSTLIERGSEVVIDNDDRLYEVIKGQKVEKPVGASQVMLANRIAFAINRHAVPEGSGFAIVEILVDIGHPDRDQFRPDLIFVSSERWPLGRNIPPGNAWAIIPDLAVEVVSPSNTADEIREKIEIYLSAGVRLVWVIYPRLRCVDIHAHSPNVRVVGLAESLEGGDVLPDFRLPLAELFGQAAEPG